MTSISIEIKLTTLPTNLQQKRKETYRLYISTIIKGEQSQVKVGQIFKKKRVAADA